MGNEVTGDISKIGRGTFLMTLHGETISNSTSKRRQKRTKGILKNWELYLFLLPALLWYIIFCYVPMYGIQIAFKNFQPGLGIWDSPWVGLRHFKRFFNSHYFGRLIKNTIGISLYGLLLGFPIPIILALSINELNDGLYKKTLQTVTYAPHFISTVVMAGMIIMFLSPETGIVNLALQKLGKEPIPFLTKPEWFKTVYVVSGVWQSMGWNSIIYLAALSGVDPQLHEAAIVDGASRLKRIWYINLPALVPTMTILLILSAGGILSVGHEKILLLQNNLNITSSDVISTYVYRAGLLSAQYSFSSAVGLFNSIINAIILILVNQFASRVSENSLW